MRPVQLAFPRYTGRLFQDTTNLACLNLLPCWLGGWLAGDGDGKGWGRDGMGTGRDGVGKGWGRDGMGWDGMLLSLL